MMADPEQLARQIAPQDLGAEPFYVLKTSDGLPPEFSVPDVAGMHASFLDLGAKPWLEGQGLWRGRGPTVLLNDVAIRTDSLTDADGDEAFAAELYNGRLLAVLCHELGHIFSQPIERGTVDFVLGAMVLQAVASWKPRELGTPELPTPWTGHEAGFVRVLCHVTHRAEAILGERLPGSWLLGRVYQLAPLDAYADALGDELESMAGESFEAIRSQPLPEAFLTIWRSDVARFFKNNESLLSHFWS